MKSKKFPKKPKIAKREVITDQSDPRMIKFREEHGEFKPGYPRKTVKLEITEYEAGPDGLKIKEVVGYYEGEPPPGYTAFLRELVKKAMIKLSEEKERESWSQELSINIREYNRKDRKAVLQLWKTCGLSQPYEEPMRDINRRMKIGPDLFLVGVINDVIVATVIGRCDENQGWVEYLAVNPAFRRKRIGYQLLKIIEEKLHAKGCSGINLLIEPDNAAATEFFQKAGYYVKNVAFLEKKLRYD